jgi:hypothetical protein
VKKTPAEAQWVVIHGRSDGAEGDLVIVRKRRRSRKRLGSLVATASWVGGVAMAGLV